MGKRLGPWAGTAVAVLVGVAIGHWSATSPSEAALRKPLLKATASSVDSAPAPAAKTPERFGSVIGVKRETLDKYLALHKACWPGVLKQIRASNIRNYSIYLGELDDGNLYLFSYFEYVGGDFAGDMAKMKLDKTTQEWWKNTDPLQTPLKNRKPGEHWMTMKEVFHTD